MPSTPLKNAMIPGARLPGIWLSLCSPTVTEIAAGSGADWLLVDMEHAPADLSQIADHLRAARGAAGDSGAEVIVRPPSSDQVMTKRLLDIGVRNLMFPMIQDAEAARQAVSWTRYAPEGVRGISATIRANDYARQGDYLSRYAEELCLIVQVETPEALANIAEIAAVPGVDAIFVGPGDLAAAMGYPGQTMAEPVQQAIAEALAAIHAGGKAAGILGYGEAAARRYFEMGFDFTAIAGDAWMLARELDGLVARLAR